jgi:hypothetical protein
VSATRSPHLVPRRPQRTTDVTYKTRRPLRVIHSSQRENPVERIYLRDRNGEVNLAISARRSFIFLKTSELEIIERALAITKGPTPVSEDIEVGEIEVSATRRMKFAVVWNGTRGIRITFATSDGAPTPPATFIAGDDLKKLERMAIAMRDEASRKKLLWVQLRTKHLAELARSLWLPCDATPEQIKDAINCLSNTQRREALRARIAEILSW